MQPCIVRLVLRIVVPALQKRLKRDLERASLPVVVKFQDKGYMDEGTMLDTFSESEIHNNAVPQNYYDQIVSTDNAPQDIAATTSEHTMVMEKRENIMVGYNRCIKADFEITTHSGSPSSFRLSYLLEIYIPIGILILQRSVKTTIMLGSEHCSTLPTSSKTHLTEPITQDDEHFPHSSSANHSIPSFDLRSENDSTQSISMQDLESLINHLELQLDSLSRTLDISETAIQEDSEGFEALRLKVRGLEKVLDGLFEDNERKEDGLDGVLVENPDLSGSEELNEASMENVLDSKKLGSIESGSPQEPILDDSIKSPDEAKEEEPAAPLPFETPEAEDDSDQTSKTDNTEHEDTNLDFDGPVLEFAEDRKEPDDQHEAAEHVERSSFFNPATTSIPDFSYTPSTFMSDICSTLTSSQIVEYGFTVPSMSISNIAPAAEEEVGSTHVETEEEQDYVWKEQQVSEENRDVSGQTFGLASTSTPTSKATAAMKSWRGSSKTSKLKKRRSVMNVFLFEAAGDVEDAPLVQYM
ncbi:hypothetical protein HDV05_005198 [Chytridiales sp. JEL 0842]|nr:hypothetical protein HDV05_005198 [Chytridiales sp. JEL 0842]